MEINANYEDMENHEFVVLHVKGVRIEELLPVKVVDGLLYASMRHKEVHLAEIVRLSIGAINKVILELDGYRILHSDFANQQMQVLTRSAILKLRAILALVNEFQIVEMELNERIHEERGY